MRDLVGICHDRPSEAHCFVFLQTALQALPSLVCPQNAISNGSLPLVARTKSQLRKKNAYSLQDRIVFVDQWVNCLFGSFPHPLYGRGGWVPIFRVCSDLDQNRAVFWSKSEHETPETPETLETPETVDVDVRIAIL